MFPFYDGDKFAVVAEHAGAPAQCTYMTQKDNESVIILTYDYYSPSQIPSGYYNSVQVHPGGEYGNGYGFRVYFYRNLPKGTKLTAKGYEYATSWMKILASKLT